MTDIADLALRVNTLELAAAERALREFSDQGKRTEKEVKGSTERMASSFGALSGAIGLISGALASIGLASVTETIAQFQASANRMAATSGATATQLAALEKQARSLGATTAFSGKQVVDAQNFMFQAGLSVNDTLKNTSDMLKLASASGLDLATTADIVTNILGGMQLGVEELSRVNDVLAKTSASANTDIVQLGHALSYAAPLAASANISIESLSSAMGVLGDSGFQGSRGGTAMLGMIRQLSKATPAARGALSNYGLTLGDVNIKTHGLEAVLIKLRDANISTADSFTIFGSEVAPAAEILAAGADRVAELAAINREAAGSVDEMARVIAQGLSPALDALGSAVSESVLQFGDSGFAGALEKAILATTGVIASLNGMGELFAEANNLTEAQVERLNMATEALALLGDTAKIVAAIYVTSLVSSIAASTVAFIAGQWQALQYQAALARMAGISYATAAGLTAVAVAARAANAAMAFFGGPIGLALAGIGLLAAGIYQVSQASKESSEEMDTLTEKLANLTDEAEKAATATKDAFEPEPVIEITKKLREQLTVYNMTNPELARYLALKEDATEALADEAAELQSFLDVLDAQAEALKKLKEAEKAATEEMNRFADSVLNTLDPLRSIESEVKKVWAAFDAGKLDSSQAANYIDHITSRLKEPEKIIETTERLREQLAVYGMTNVELARYKALKEGATEALADEAAELQSFLDVLDAQTEAFERLREAEKTATEEMDSFVDSVLDALDPLRSVESQMEKVWAAFDAGKLDADQVASYIDHITSSLKELEEIEIDPLKKMGGSMQTVAGGIKDVAGAMQGMYEVGDRGYKNMAVVMQAANVVAAVGAVLQQGMGDPYTAFARMATMASTVAALGYSVGNIGGGFEDTAAIRQAQQGTGTVLGDAAAKSESIANAVEITADATRELVGINRGMLTALQNMQLGISGASVRVARGAKNVDFGATYKPSNIFDSISKLGSKAIGMDIGLKLADTLSLGLLGGAFKAAGKLLGGSSKVTDEGIQIIGGALSDMIDGVTVEAYQTVNSKKYKWSSSKTSESFESLGADVAKQFGLVFESLADSVYHGATALGLAGDDVADTINNFVIETQKISLKGLDAKEQQAEIEAVFSAMFDNLAESTVKFLPKFQQAGEGLGETLARVATNVQVTEEAIFRLGFAASETVSIEQFATLSTYLIQAAGGLEDFISGMSSFVDKFAPEAHKLELLTADMTRALSEVGLAVPATSDEMWELMQSLNATTEAGARQVATLLRLSDTAKAYYKMLEDEANRNLKLQAELEAAYFDSLTNAYRKLTASINVEIQAVTAAYNEQQESVRAQIDATNSKIQNAEALSRAIANVLEVVQVDTAASRLQSRQLAQSQLTTALAIAKAGGVLPDANSMSDTFKELSKPSMDLYSSMGEFAVAQGLVANDLSELDKLTAEQLSTEEMILQQLKSAQRRNELNFNNQVDSLNSQLEESKKQYNALMGIDDKLLSVIDALSEFNRIASTPPPPPPSPPVAPPPSPPVAPPSGAELVLPELDSAAGGTIPLVTDDDIIWRINQITKELGHNDDAYHRIYEFANAWGVPLSRLENFIPGAGQWVEEQGLPAFADGGFHTGGIRMVGEKGPEIEVTAPSRIYSNSDSKKLFDQSELISEIRKLREQNDNLMKQLLTKVTSVEHDTRTIKNIKREEVTQ